MRGVSRLRGRSARWTVLATPTRWHDRDLIEEERPMGIHRNCVYPPKVVVSTSGRGTRQNWTRESSWHGKARGHKWSKKSGAGAQYDRAIDTPKTVAASNGRAVSARRRRDNRSILFGRLRIYLYERALARSRSVSRSERPFFYQADQRLSK